MKWINLKVLVAFMMLLVTIYGAAAATDATHQTNVTVLAGNLSIISVTPPTTPNPTEYTTTATNTVFLVRSDNGPSSINVTSAVCFYSKAGETTRTSSSCSNLTGGSATDLNITCPITMYYYDGAGTWAVNCTVSDNNGATRSNATQTLTYGSLSAMQSNFTGINFGGVYVGTPAVSSVKTFINTGNNNFTQLGITGQNLYSLGAPGFAPRFDVLDNFRIDLVNNDYAGADVMVIAGSTKTVSYPLVRANSTRLGVLDTYLWVNAPSVPAQEYATCGVGPGGCGGHWLFAVS